MTKRNDRHQKRVKTQLEYTRQHHACNIGNLYVTEDDSRLTILWWVGVFPNTRDSWLNGGTVLQYIDCYMAHDFIVFKFLWVEKGQLVTATANPWPWLRPYGTIRAE